MGKEIKIGVCQMRVEENKESNINKARLMIKEAAASGCGLAILPEMFNCPYDSKLFSGFAEEYPGGVTTKMLAETAYEEKIAIIGGSIPERENNSIYNTSFVFGPRGQLLAKHQKLHLFDVELEGGLTFKESKTLGKGNSITVVKTDLVTFGVAICYDIRFPELTRLMALEGAEMVIFPAAFNMITGPAHWELLLRSRAVDNQVFIAGAAPARDHNASYISYANSAVVDPWGNIIARAGEEETILYSYVNLEQVSKVRRELPLLKHRRLDLYQLQTCK